MENPMEPIIERIEEFINQSLDDIKTRLTNEEHKGIVILIPKHIWEKWFACAYRKVATKYVKKDPKPLENIGSGVSMYKGTRIVYGPLVNVVMVYHEDDSLKDIKPNVMGLDTLSGITEIPEGCDHPREMIQKGHSPHHPDYCWKCGEEL